MGVMRSVERQERRPPQLGMVTSAGEVVLAFTYRPLRQDDGILDKATDSLAELFSDLSPRCRGRAIVEFTKEDCRHWLLLHLGDRLFDDPGLTEGVVAQQRTLVERLRRSELRLEIASAKACDELVHRFPHPQVEEGRVVDHRGRTVVTMRLRESGDVTRPGITRELVDFLCAQNDLAYLVLDFRNQANGLSRFDLTIVLTATDETAGQFAAREAEEVVFNGMGALTSQDTTRRAVIGTLQRTAPFARAFARLPAYAANIADLFPL